MIRRAVGYRSKYEVTELVNRNRDKIRSLLEGTNFIVGYSPCKQIPCENGGSCSDKLVIYDDARITDSQALILTSPRMIHEMTCKCRDGFTGDKCERRQDPCSPNPCLLVSNPTSLPSFCSFSFTLRFLLKLLLWSLSGGTVSTTGLRFPVHLPDRSRGKIMRAWKRRCLREQSVQERWIVQEKSRQLQFLLFVPSWVQREPLRGSHGLLQAESLPIRRFMRGRKAWVSFFFQYNIKILWINNKFLSVLLTDFI